MPEEQLGFAGMGGPPGGSIPSAPIQTEQQRIPFQGAEPVHGTPGAAPGPAPGPPTPQFAAKGLGRYINRNANGVQFNTPAIKGAVEKGLDAYATAKYFQHEGMGAAMRHTLGMRQTPSHMNDWIRARHGQDTNGQQHQPGINPDPVIARRTRPGRNDPNYRPQTGRVQHGQTAPTIQDQLDEFLHGGGAGW